MNLLVILAQALIYHGIVTFIVYDTQINIVLAQVLLGYYAGDVDGSSSSINNNQNAKVGAIGSRW